MRKGSHLLLQRGRGFAGIPQHRLHLMYSATYAHGILRTTTWYVRRMWGLKVGGVRDVLMVNKQRPRHRFHRTDPDMHFQFVNCLSPFHLK